MEQMYASIIHLSTFIRPSIPITSPRTNGFWTQWLSEFEACESENLGCWCNRLQSSFGSSPGTPTGPWTAPHIRLTKTPKSAHFQGTKFRNFRIFRPFSGHRRQNRTFRPPFSGRLLVRTIELQKSEKSWSQTCPTILFEAAKSFAKNHATIYIYERIIMNNMVKRSSICSSVHRFPNFWRSSRKFSHQNQFFSRNSAAFRASRSEGFFYYSCFQGIWSDGFFAEGWFSGRAR